MFSFKKYIQNEYLINMLFNEKRCEVIALRITFKDDFYSHVLHWTFLLLVSKWILVPISNEALKWLEVKKVVLLWITNAFLQNPLHPPDLFWK